MKLSLVIPCYNEARNIPLLLDRCKYISSQPGVEIILVDNGSTDDSSIVFNELLPSYPNCRVVRVDVNQGYGFGILSGLKDAKGEILGWTHADMQTDPNDAVKSLEVFSKYGVRVFVKGRRYGRPLGDTVFTMGMSFFESMLLGEKMWDINAQPTMFPRSFYETWVNPPNDFSLDLYAYYQACMQKLTIKRFPVVFGKRVHGISHWNINFASKWKFIERTVKFSFELKKMVNR